jgi:hypothetical protein
MLDVFSLVQEDKVRQEQLDEEYERAAHAAAAAAAGRAVLSAKQREIAERDAQAARNATFARKPHAYTVQADELYPAMLDMIEDVLAGTLDRHPSVLHLYLRAKDLVQASPQALEWARRGRDEFDDGDVELGPRAEALEIARLWFTRMLKSEVKPLVLRIIPGDFRFKL